MDNKMLGLLFKATSDNANDNSTNNYNTSSIASVVSNDGTTLTIQFLGTSDNIAGIHYISGQTIIAGNKVVVVKCNNSPKSSDWYCVKLS